MKEKNDEKILKIEKIAKEEKKKNSFLFDIFGILAIILVIIFAVYVLKNKKDDDTVSMNEKWKFKSDNNSNGMIDVGDELCLYTECFYVISNDGKHLKALSKYNLDIGYNCVYKEEKYFCDKIKNETNIQNEKAIGFNNKTYNTTGNYGVTDFSKKVYWKLYDEYDKEDANDLEIELDVSYNIPNNYLKIYKNKLKYFGQEVVDVTLITRGELINLGCHEIFGSCNTEYDWLYSTSYWTRTSRSKGNIWKIQTSNYFSSNFYNDNYFNGIRPVVVIDLDNFNVEK